MDDSNFLPRQTPRKSASLNPRWKLEKQMPTNKHGKIQWLLCEELGEGGP
jgi:hypothetical protein